MQYSEWVQDLSNSIKKNELVYVEALLLNDVTQIDSYNGEGQSLLTVAILEEQHEVVQWLINAGANVSMQNRDGTSSLYWAIIGGDAASAGILIENGAINQDMIESLYNTGLVLPIEVDV